MELGSRDGAGERGFCRGARMVLWSRDGAGMELWSKDGAGKQE